MSCDTTTIIGPRLFGPQTRAQRPAKTVSAPVPATSRVQCPFERSPARNAARPAGSIRMAVEGPDVPQLRTGAQSLDRGRGNAQAGRHRSYGQQAVFPAAARTASRSPFRRQAPGAPARTAGVACGRRHPVQQRMRVRGVSRLPSMAIHGRSGIVDERGPGLVWTERSPTGVHRRIFGAGSFE